MILHIGLSDGKLCKDFINKKENGKFESKFVSDNLVEIDKIKRLKDYIKNNSFFIGKLKIIQLKYFNQEKQRITTFAEKIKKQSNIEYIDYFEAKEIYSMIEMEKKYSPCKNVILNNLNKILMFSKRNKIKISLISNITYKGVRDDWLFYTNLLISDFAEKNSLLFIDLSKIKNFTVFDFYDNHHTTPIGSEKIAKFIYPKVVKFLNTND